MNSFFTPGYLVALLVIPGCAKAPNLPTVPVTGNVTYKGRPVADAHISFMPEDNASGKPATGVTDSQGRFTLQTYVGGSTFAVGALTGEYIVIVKQGLPTKKEVSIMSVEEWSKLSPEERTKKGTGLMTKVQRSGEDSNDVASASASESALPMKYSDVKNPVLKRSVRAGGTNDFPLELTD